MLGNLHVTCYDVAMIFQLVANFSDTRLLAFPTKEYHIVKDTIFGHDWAN
jgi:hypothetical protein